MPLIGALPQPITSAPSITSAPLALFVYLVVILMLVTALASVVLRNTLWVIASFALSMALVALLYLTIAPLLLFAVQLVVYTTVSAGLLLGLLSLTSGLERPPISEFGRKWLAGGSVAAAFGALLVLVVAAIPWPQWPLQPFRAGIISQPESLARTLSTDYIVGIAVLVVVIATAALGSALLLAAPILASHRGEASVRAREPRR